MGQWFNQSIEKVQEKLGVVPKAGLSNQEVTVRLKKYGTNHLQTRKKLNPFSLFFSQFKDVLVFVLIISATVSLVLSLVQEEGSISESLLIFVIVIAIAIVGFFNEYKAEKTVEALSKLVGLNAEVRRNGKNISIGADQLVPGDIVILNEGQKIPADLRLIKVKNLLINEASLTGESLAVEKNTLTAAEEVSLGDRKNMAYAGTFIAAGTGEGIVVETAQNTELGKIAKLVSSIEIDETPMQRKLDDLGKKLGLFILLICVVVFIVIFFFVDEAVDKSQVQRLVFAFTAAVALAVAAIPEGLAFVVRINLALGARRMAAKNALVRKLSAVEALGSTDIICVDKTGTLTRGEMTVREAHVLGRKFEFSGSGYQLEGSVVGGESKNLDLLLRIGVLCNNSHMQSGVVLGDSTEGALLVSSEKNKQSYEAIREEMLRVDEVPFTSERKIMTTVHKADDGFFIAHKGAVEVTLRICNSYLDSNGNIKKLTDEVRAEIVKLNSRLAGKAMRVLAFAYKQVNTRPKDDKSIEEDLIYVGLQAMMDPPREEVIEVVHRVHSESGIRVIMITGDYIETAKAVAREVGIKGEALTGAELDEMCQADFESMVESVSVYARVNPEHKIRIVQALQKHGHQVAMTGDGVNDAPAIKAADIGIAMGMTGTDAAKEAADLILLDDQFLTIINAIEEGRGIFDNVRKFVNFLISCNIAEVITVLFGIIFFQNLILTAAQILFINIVTDGLPAVALGNDPSQRNVLRAKPQRFQEAILTRRVWVEIFIYGGLMSAALLVQYWYNFNHGGLISAASAAFVAMVVYELVRLIDIRTDYNIRWFSNPWLSFAIVLSLGLQLAVLYIPSLASYFSVGILNYHDWMFMFIGSISLFFIMKALNPFFDRFGAEVIK